MAFGRTAYVSLSDVSISSDDDNIGKYANACAAHSSRVQHVHAVCVSVHHDTGVELFWSPTHGYLLAALALPKHDYHFGVGTIHVDSCAPMPPMASVYSKTRFLRWVEEVDASKKRMLWQAMIDELELSDWVQARIVNRNVRVYVCEAACASFITEYMGDRAH
jgi:hypothetical protein